MNTNGVDSSNSNPSVSYEKSVSKCTRDLVIKKMALSIIILLNVAALGAIFTYITLYCPIPERPLLISTFVVGVLGALVSLKVPTLGVTGGNYTQFTNPVSLLGRAATLILFGPVLLVIKKIDWTNYADPYVANQVSEELSRLSFKELSPLYGPRIENLKKYGFISQEKAQKLKDLHEHYQKHKKAHDLFLTHSKNFLKEITDDKAENLFLQNLDKTKESLEDIESDWLQLKHQIIPSLPRPETNIPDYGSWKTRFYMLFRKYLVV